MNAIFAAVDISSFSTNQQTFIIAALAIPLGFAAWKLIKRVLRGI